MLSGSVGMFELADKAVDDSRSELPQPPSPVGLPIHRLPLLSLQHGLHSRQQSDRPSGKREARQRARDSDRKRPRGRERCEKSRKKNPKSIFEKKPTLSPLPPDASPQIFGKTTRLGDCAGVTIGICSRPTFLATRTVLPCLRREKRRSFAGRLLEGSSGNRAHMAGCSPRLDLGGQSAPRRDPQ
jgi:hypothetical protein